MTPAVARHTASRTLRALSVVILGVLAAAGVRAETVSDFTLDNGLQVVVIEDSRAPVVVQMMWYRVGSADETPGLSGLAHYLEHLMFKATDTMPSGGFSTAVAAYGGSDNAFTSWDYTAYFQRVPADRLDSVMRMEADRMVNLQMTAEEAATELAVVLEERAMRTDNDPGSLFFEQRMAAQFLNHPYGRPIIGWRHEVSALTREDAFAFYRYHYAPNNAVLVVAGDVTVAQVRDLAQQHYGAIPANPAIGPRRRPLEPPHLAERRLSLADPRVGQPYVARTYLAPARRTGAQDEAAALVVLAELLGGASASSVLGRALEFDSRTAVYTSASYNATALDDTLFSLVVAPAPGISLDEAEAAMDAEIARFLETGVDQAAFDRIMAQLRASEVYARDNTMGVAHRYGDALLTGLTVADQQDWPRVLQSVTPQQVMAAAERLFDRRRAVTAHLAQETTQ
jgi:zinc protease